MNFGNKKQFASNGFDFVQKQRNQRKRQKRFDDDEKWNELQTYVSLEKMLHKAIHAIRQLKKKGNTNTSPAPKQQKLRTNLFEEGGNDVPRFVDQSIGADQHGDQDVLNNLTEVRSSDRTDQTDRAVPRASRLELRLEPRPDDRTDRTGARLP
ncbi:hypothetical protein F2Q70_00039188 [Brassica cretica]|uniref:Uncharacterized protein n=1 Tax=Brassica cretica TaxID=69181 RepID=A0A8S9K255_BRACR|nr:hypothetical protein F2Q70_00039188 [Brassica cretica]